MNSSNNNIDTTVIIPNYNSELYIARALDSVMHQSYQGFKVLIVDDGSQDKSLEIANTYLKHLPLTIHPLENIGITANWNRAIRLVDTEYFTLLHCDDELAPQYLETLRALLIKDKSLGIAHCAALSINEQSQPSQSPVEQYKINKYFKDQLSTRAINIEYKMLLSGDYIVCPAVFYRTSAIKKIGFFNENYQMVQDWEYWFRVLLNGYHIGNTNQLLFRYRRHSLNQSKLNSADLSRYQEEKSLIDWAHTQGISNGLLSAAEPKSYGLIIKTATVDIVNDLLIKQPAEAKKKLQHVEQLLPIKQYQFAYLLLKLCIKLGRWGGHFLDILMKLYIRALKIVRI